MLRLKIFGLGILFLVTWLVSVSVVSACTLCHDTAIQSTHSISSSDIIVVYNIKGGVLNSTKWTDNLKVSNHGFCNRSMGIKSNGFNTDIRDFTVSNLRVYDTDTINTTLNLNGDGDDQSEVVIRC